MLFDFCLLEPLFIDLDDRKAADALGGKGGWNPFPDRELQSLDKHRSV